MEKSLKCYFATTLALSIVASFVEPFAILAILGLNMLVYLIFVSRKTKYVDSEFYHEEAILSESFVDNIQKTKESLQNIIVENYYNNNTKVPKGTKEGKVLWQHAVSSSGTWYGDDKEWYVQTIASSKPNGVAYYNTKYAVFVEALNSKVNVPVEWYTTEEFDEIRKTLSEGENENNK